MAAAPVQRDRGIRRVHGKPGRRAGRASREGRRRSGLHADLRTQRDDRPAPRPLGTVGARHHRAAAVRHGGVRGVRCRSSAMSSRRRPRRAVSSSVPGTTGWRCASPPRCCTIGGAASCTGIREAMSGISSPPGSNRRRNGSSVGSANSRAEELDGECGHGVGSRRHRRADSALADHRTLGWPHVTDVRVEQIAHGQRLLVAAVPAAPDRATACRSTLIAKLPAESEARGAMEMLGGYRRELAFYRNVAGHAPIATPQGICRADGRGLRRLHPAARGSAGLGQRRPPRGPVDESGATVHRTAGGAARLVDRPRECLCAGGVSEHRHPDCA